MEPYTQEIKTLKNLHIIVGTLTGTAQSVIMQPFKANLLNAAVLIIFGMWAYLNMAAESRSMTVLIPVFFGVMLGLLTPIIKQQNKLATYVGAGLTLLIAVALIMPLKGSIGRDDALAIFRVGTMMFFAIFALLVFIKSFMSSRSKI